MLFRSNFHVTPTTFIFSGKAASSYTFAKETIRLINSVADVINNDARVNEVMKVCFIPNFRVSNAQLIYPAAEISSRYSRMVRSDENQPEEAVLSRALRFQVSWSP